MPQQSIPEPQWNLTHGDPVTELWTASRLLDEATSMVIILKPMPRLVSTKNLRTNTAHDLSVFPIGRATLDS